MSNLPEGPAAAEVKAGAPGEISSAAQAGELTDSNGLPVRRMIEKERLIEGVEKAAWVQAKAARLLGLSLRQVIIS